MLFDAARRWSESQWLQEQCLKDEQSDRADLSTRLQGFANSRAWVSVQDDKDLRPGSILAKEAPALDGFCSLLP